MQQHISLSRWLWRLHSRMPKLLWANCNPQRGESISINLLTNVQSRLATQATASAPVVAAHPNMAIYHWACNWSIKMNCCNFMQWIVLSFLFSILIAVSISTSSMREIPDSWLFFSMQVQWLLWCDCWRIDCLHGCHHCSHVIVAVLIYISSCTFAVDCCVNFTSRCLK
jgi:hypothetical protein